MSGVRASPGTKMVSRNVCLVRYLCGYVVFLTSPLAHSFSAPYLSVSTDRDMRRSGVRASHGANILAGMFALLDIGVFR